MDERSIMRVHDTQTDLVQEMERIARERSEGVWEIERHIRIAFLRHEAFETPNAFPCGGRSVVHPSATKSDRLQLTWFDDQGPSGHCEPRTIKEAAERVWDDLTAEQRAAFRGKRSVVQ